MGNCFGLIRDIDTYTPEEYIKIVSIYSWRFERVKYSFTSEIKLDNLYDCNGFPFIRLNRRFIEKCIEHIKITDPYNITEKRAQFIVSFHNTHDYKLNSIVPYNEDMNIDGNLGFSYI